MLKFDPFKIYEFTFCSDGMISYCLIPIEIEVCCCCNSQLEVNFDEWEFNDVCNAYIPTSIDLDCTRPGCFEEYENSDYWRMPYVYWLPIDESCKQWIIKMLYIYYNVKPYPKSWLEKNGQMRLFNKKGEIPIGG